MLKFFRNLSIQAKILIIPGVVLSMMLVQGTVTYFSGKLTEKDVHAITGDLVQDSNIATELLREIFQQRMAMKNYVQTSSQEAVDKFRHYSELHLDLKKKATQAITNPARVKILNDIETLHVEYEKIFNDVVISNMQERHKLVENVLDVHGPKMEKALTDIMQTAHDDYDIEAAYQAGMAQKHLLLARLYVYKFLKNNDDASVKRVKQEITLFYKNLDAMETLLQNPRRRQLMNETRLLMNKYQTGFTQVVEHIKARNTGIQQMDKIGPQIAALSDSLQLSVFNSLQEKSDHVDGLIQNSNMLTILLVSLALIFGGVFSYFASRAIVNPLLTITKLLKEISEGDGDLTVRLPVMSNDAIGKLAINFNNFVEKLQSLIESIQSSVVQLTSSANQLSSVASESYKTMQVQVDETDHVSAAVEEMGTTLNEVSNNVLHTAEITSTNRSEAIKGRALEADALNAINNLSNDINETADVVKQVGESSETVNNVVEVINNIAEQTNLLALNAAIEAARAGEQGRGFAVVADEVRTLAGRTQESTQEIRKTVELLRDNVQNAVDRISTGSEHAENVVAQAKQVDVIFSQISEGIEQIAGMTTQVSTATEEQTAVSASISQSLEKLTDQTTKNTTAISQVYTAANELTELAKNIESRVGRFKIAS